MFIKDKINKNGILFIQEIHSTIDESKWKGKCQGDLLHSQGSSISHGVLNGLFGFESIDVKSRLSNTNGCTLILHMVINDEGLSLYH